MIPPSLHLKTVVAIAFAVLLVLQNGTRAVLLNRTIENSDIGNFGCTITACDATSTQLDPCTTSNGVGNQTFSIVRPVSTSSSCALTVPFNGTAIYAFLSCTTPPGCQIEVVDTGMVPQAGVSEQTSILPLGFFRDSLSNNSHILIISSTESFLVDKFIHTFRIDDGSSDPLMPIPTAGSSSLKGDVGGRSSTTLILSTQSSLTVDFASSTSEVAVSMSTASTSQSSTLPSSPPVSPSSRKSMTNIAVILGGAIGGLIFGAAIMITVFVWCRRMWLRRRREHHANVLQPYLPPESWSSAAYQNLSRKRPYQPLALQISFSNNRHSNPSQPHRPPGLRDETQGGVQEGVVESMQAGNDGPPPEYFA